MLQLNLGEAFIRHELTLPLVLVVLIAIPLADVAGIGEHPFDVALVEILPSLALDIPLLAQLKQAIVSVHTQERGHDPLDLFQLFLIGRVSAYIFPTLVLDRIEA